MFLFLFYFYIVDVKILNIIFVLLFLGIYFLSYFIFCNGCKNVLVILELLVYIVIEELNIMFVGGK